MKYLNNQELHTLFKLIRRFRTSHMVGINTRNGQSTDKHMNELLDIEEIVLSEKLYGNSHGHTI